MPQLFQVLRCYQCMAFQVHQCKKSSKFECKLCGEKQSIKRRYGLGTAKECRHHVQKLNILRGEKDEDNANNINSTSSSDEEIENKPRNNINYKHSRNFKSKWSNFIEEEPEETQNVTPSESMYLNNTEVVLEVPKKRLKGKFKAPIKDFVKPTDSNKFHDNESFSMYSDEPSSHITFNNRPPKAKLLNGLADKSSDTEIAKQNCSTNHPCLKKVNKKFVPPPRTKWSQYMEPSTSNTVVGHPQELFALCKDEDLDNVLFMY